MCTFDGVSKKTAICFFVVFEIGWIMYTAGLCVAVREDRSLLPQLLPLFLPYYPTAIGGQIVVALILLHVGLRSGYARAVIGVLSTILNVIYFASVGYMIIASRFERLTIGDYTVMFIGTILITMSWSFIQLFTVLHDLPPKHSKNLWCTFDSSSGHTEWNSWHHIIFTQKVRFLSSSSIILSAFGWLLSLKGIRNAVPGVDSHYFMEWTATYTPPFLYLAALLHAGSAGRITHMMHIASSILNTFFIVSMGYMVISGGESLLFYSPIGNSTQLLLIGGTASLFFWTIVLVLWPFYHSGRENATTHRTSQK